MSYRLTVGPIERKGNRELAVITEGGHPQATDSGTCTVCTVAWVDELPNGDAKAWFKEQIALKPWETRQ